MLNWLSKLALLAMALSICLMPVIAKANSLGRTRVAWGLIEPGVHDCGDDCFTSKGDVGIARLGTGSYRLEMGVHLFVPDPSDFQISTVSNFLCVTSGWTIGPRKSVYAYVNCYDTQGNPADAYFTFLYQSRTAPFGGAGKGIAFLLADQPTETSYTPNPAYQFNSTGAVNSMTRSGTGAYTAIIPGLTKKGGNVQVTAYGSGPARCKTSGWTSDESGTSVNVLCFDASGAPADEMFTLAYTLNEPLGLFTPGKDSPFGDTGAYAWADKPGKTKPYIPAKAYNYNGFKTGFLTAQKTATGTYTVTVPNAPQFNIESAVLVTAYGNDNDFCTWGSLFQEQNYFQVTCYDQNGNPADSKFSAAVQTILKH